MPVQQDLFMQYYPIKVTTAANAATVVETEFSTGLSIRGQFAWLIHNVEVHFNGVMGLAADNGVNLVLSTVTGSTSLPTVDEPGTICRVGWTFPLTTSGLIAVPNPTIWRSLPPTIIAAPKLYVYIGCGVDTANFQSIDWYARIGYTTVPLDVPMYLEIAETFNVV